MCARRGDSLSECRGGHYLDVVDGVYPAPPLGGAVGLEGVGRHRAVELIEVDEQEGA